MTLENNKLNLKFFSRRIVCTVQNHKYFEKIFLICFITNFC